MLHLKASDLHLCIVFHFKEGKQQTPLDSVALPSPPRWPHPKNTSQSQCFPWSPCSEWKRGWEWGGRQLQAELLEGRKFCFACKALTQVHRHTSERSLTGVRKQSKLLRGYSSPLSQPAGEAKSDWFCSTCCVLNSIPPAPQPPTNRLTQRTQVIGDENFP